MSWRVFGLLVLLAGSSASAERVAIGELVENRPSLVDPTATYTLYVPAKAAGTDPAPVLLIFDPRGRARMAAELYRPAADRHGWILVSSHDTRSDGPWAPNQKAIDALWPEIRRFNIDERRIYATGFSGGAIVSWFLAQGSGEIAGVIAVGGRLPPEIPTDKVGFAHFGAAGAWDFNYDEMVGIDKLVAKKGQPHRLEVFQGPHTWFDQQLASEAVDWMEVQAMRRGLRPEDPVLVEEIWQADTAAAAALEAQGDLLSAGRRWEAIGRSFEGVHDVAIAHANAARLMKLPEFRRAEKALERADAAALRYDREILPRVAAAFAPGAIATLDGLVRALEVDRLEAAVAKGGAAGTAAKRSLFELATQASFYLYRDLVAAKRWRDVEVSLQLAVRLDPTNWFNHYNLACARVYLGKTNDAIDNLERAVEFGFSDAAAMRADPDLAPLWLDPPSARRIEALVQRIAPP